MVEKNIPKNGDISKAPTPQNTPSSVTGSYMRSQAPTVSTIDEEVESQNNPAAQLASNPALLQMIQGKLSTLVGQPSGYIENLSPVVKKRVYGLKAVQQQQMKLEAEFQKELLELEKKYFGKYQPLYERRKQIIVGETEPTQSEVDAGEEIERTEHPDIDQNDDRDATEDDDSEEVGIPNFWLTALENLQTVAETITERDSEVLANLKDIRMEYLSTPGFQLIFEFVKNDFFKNTILTKTYHYQPELGYSGDFVYDHADGCEIDWTSTEKNVTISIERRKQRNKTTKQTRTIEKLTPTESFFNFFDPPKPPKLDDDEEGDEDEDEEDDLEGRLELDYQLGEEIKDRLIPRAVDWFTGDAVELGFPENFEDDEEYESGEDDEEDSDDDKPKENPPECKQQ
ncbi:hypothetical protein DIURU_002412 [Diutina rugosa]|uniref:Nucleosome assembly protein n=1 Tax=Diutina rugosa TaxID=5481 RepID=A0A642UV44_DIURU|nr:uncharacterized protein DIURU_002412 [Diutina rugosa]KAA8903526.1 hypothetical protein DIURU_002412 [Diutina rugosa]